MKSSDFKKIAESLELSEAEKTYIIDVYYGFGGQFVWALFDAIARADPANRARLALGFPDEVAAYRSWVEGDLHERASRVVGSSIDILEPDEHKEGL